MCFYFVCCSVSDFILYLVAIIFPPAAVVLRSGCCSIDFFINILLTILGFVPGMLHAFYYITITSPLRNNTEYLYVYQEGYVQDPERLDNAVQNSTPTLQTPLIYGSHSDHHSSTDRPSNGQNETKKSSTPAPPPYTELP
ncbi:hypothetical protein Kpol_1020p15 [Vanderwaltozyma polyspora DSM 70294]|uniref:Plasma membrane proteolipid 3 n=1 Tax=Vanderwaltozyma polyspora (strain ATCC 22028 / DSM 70294 / BCRC 21397 / CBS 2163 / NBRC 10782 / NRRL Y-8283 / UCD 57-17) TaxID=436907 RepID=A7TLC6_VANPO|nr:uncharacterized protein Kpol_1020p15 [Vanderwaltozyma polyspora DSM 70294]EDO16907.1 hypothetical protein Kpol_1020p15 [Vanderwaltozyma polyspora DSM 70294]